MLTLTYSQVRQGISNTTKGTAFVVYEDVMDAKQACDKLNGFNFQNRYLVGASSLLIRSTHHGFLSTRLDRLETMADESLQSYIISPRRWSGQKRTWRPAAKF